MTILIERTSKKLKALRLAGLAAVYIGGAMYVISDDLLGLLICGVGVVTLAVARFVTWWRHG